MSHFSFLRAEWPEIFTAAAKAELAVHPDPRTACFYARRTLELAVEWLYTHDTTLKPPYQDSLSARLYEPTFVKLTGQDLQAKIKIVKELGNRAVHGTKPIPRTDSFAAVRELFHFTYWFARTYARTAASRPPAQIFFSDERLPKTSPVPPQTAAQLTKLAEELAARDAKLLELGEELKQVRAEVAQAKLQNQAQPDEHDYSEAETRDTFIDLMLHEAGWPLDKPQDREFPVAGMPEGKGGFVDYVLWGDNGKPLAVVEAKRTRKDSAAGQQQAKLYADCLEKQYGQRPLIFLTNGYEHQLWDDQCYPPRCVQGFYKKDELELAIERRRTRRQLSAVEIDNAIVERHYQHRAIRRVCETFEQKHGRRALVEMATGAGKTRTVIALIDVLMRANWVKRVLFLADRVALVNQAVKAFKVHLPSAAPVNLVTERGTEGRVYVSTYQTLMGLIEAKFDGQRRFGSGHFDLIVIDETHRSVYQKYGAIFGYFDAMLVGLTATPRQETDHDTFGLFNLEKGVATDAYTLEEAVKDGHLVPAKSVSVPLKFQREGIQYDDLSEVEKLQWDEIEWDEEGNNRDRVDAEEVNRWLFNKDTVDKVLKHLMEKGQKVAGGDRLGKTIVFAKNQGHARFIEERFNDNYPHLKGVFARVITFDADYAQSLIDDFSIPEKSPHIALSVDMLDTGIDVPEVVNLVFFKLVRSKTKFWQMVGRGTRLRPDLFGPGQDKKFFYIFDYCQNLEFFQQNPEATDGAGSMSLTKSLFTRRVELIAELDRLTGREPESILRRDIAELLQTEVAAMNLENFIVRPKRRFVERYAQTENWQTLGIEQQTELLNEVAGLPSTLVDDDLEAKQFDLLMLRLQLTLLRAEPAFSEWRTRVEAIAGLLAAQDSIPMVRAQMPLILSLMSDEFWQDVTTPMLENVRKQIRALVKLIEKVKRKIVYTNFEDELGEGAEVHLPGFTTPGGGYENFRAKAQQFLREHQDLPAIVKVKTNQPLTQGDLAELERILLREGIGTLQDLMQAKEASQGLGLFIRSLVGLDRAAAKAEFDKFIEGKRPSPNQLLFIDWIINYLTENGFMEAGRLYESPFTDLSSRGIDGLFQPDQVTELVDIIENIRTRAAAA